MRREKQLGELMIALILLALFYQGGRRRSALAYTSDVLTLLVLAVMVFFVTGRVTSLTLKIMLVTVLVWHLADTAFGLSGMTLHNMEEWPGTMVGIVGTLVLGFGAVALRREQVLWPMAFGLYAIVALRLAESWNSGGARLHVHHYQMGAFLACLYRSGGRASQVMQGVAMGMMAHGILQFGADPAVEPRRGSRGDSGFRGSCGDRGFRGSRGDRGFRGSRGSPYTKRRHGRRHNQPRLRSPEPAGQAAGRAVAGDDRAPAQDHGPRRA